MILCLIVGVAFANVAYARIGEKLPELKKRFGKEKRESKTNTKLPFTAIYSFKKNGISIRAYFVGENKCDMITYSSSGCQYLKPKEREQLLFINRGDNKWIKTQKSHRFDGKIKLPKPKESWKSSDGVFFAYNFSNSTICILTKKYLDKQKEHDKKIKAEKQNKEKTKLDGF